MAPTRAGAVIVTVLVVSASSGVATATDGGPPIETAGTAAQEQNVSGQTVNDTNETTSLENATLPTVTVRELRVDRLAIANRTGDAGPASLTNRTDSTGPLVLRNVTFRNVSASDLSALNVTITGNQSLNESLGGPEWRGVEIGAEAMEDQEKGVHRPTAANATNITGGNATSANTTSANGTDTGAQPQARSRVEDLIIGQLDVQQLDIRTLTVRGNWTNATPSSSTATANNTTSNATTSGFRTADVTDAAVGTTRAVGSATIGQLTVGSLTVNGTVTVVRLWNATAQQNQSRNDALPAGVQPVGNVSIRRASVGSLSTDDLTVAVGNPETNATDAVTFEGGIFEGNESTPAQQRPGTDWEQATGDVHDRGSANESNGTRSNQTDQAPPNATGPEGPAENETGQA